MDGEKKFTLVAISISLLCLTVLYGFMFIALWQYREFVGLSLFFVLLFVTWVFLRGKLNEQDLRITRFRHNEETPLDDTGEPIFWRSDMQANPHRK